MNHLLFIGNLGAGEIIVIALVVLLLFGGKKIPELMKGLGKGVRSFKEGMNNIENDIENSGTENPTTKINSPSKTTNLIQETMSSEMSRRKFLKKEQLPRSA